MFLRVYAGMDDSAFSLEFQYLENLWHSVERRSDDGEHTSSRDGDIEESSDQELVQYWNPRQMRSRQLSPSTNMRKSSEGQECLASPLRVSDYKTGVAVISTPMPRRRRRDRRRPATEDMEAKERIKATIMYLSSFRIVRTTEVEREPECLE